MKLNLKVVNNIWLNFFSEVSYLINRLIACILYTVFRCPVEVQSHRGIEMTSCPPLFLQQNRLSRNVPQSNVSTVFLVKKYIKFSTPLGYTWKRVAFRSLVVLVLLFVCATMPNFSMFLDLVGGSTITLLTFVFPPFFYMRLVDSSSQNPAWEQRQRDAS